jgi:hypothetical protein
MSYIRAAADSFRRGTAERPTRAPLSSIRLICTPRSTNMVSLASLGPRQAGGKPPILGTAPYRG